MKKVQELMQILEGARSVATISDDEAAANARRKLATQRSDRLAAYGESLPEDDVARVLDGRMDSLAHQRVQRWLDADARFLWLVGSPGTGKTVALAAVVADHGGIVILGADLVRIYRFDSVSNINQRERIERCPILIVDDLGTKDRDAEQDALFTVINKRQGGRCRTLMTGNLTMAQVNDYDARILSRVRGRGAIVEIRGSDRRLPQQALRLDEQTGAP